MAGRNEAPAYSADERSQDCKQEDLLCLAVDKKRGRCCAAGLSLDRVFECESSVDVDLERGLIG